VTETILRIRMRILKKEEKGDVGKKKCQGQGSNPRPKQKSLGGLRAYAPLQAAMATAQDVLLPTGLSHHVGDSCIIWVQYVCFTRFGPNRTRTLHDAYAEFDFCNHVRGSVQLTGLTFFASRQKMIHCEQIGRVAKPSSVLAWQIQRQHL